MKNQIVQKAREANRRAILFFKFGEYSKSAPLFKQRDYLMHVARMRREFLSRSKSVEAMPYPIGERVMARTTEAAGGESLGGRRRGNRNPHRV